MLPHCFLLCVLVAVAAGSSSRNEYTPCNGIRESCQSRKVGICGAYGYPLHLGDCSGPGISGAGCPTGGPSTAKQCIGSPCSGCGEEGYDLAEQMCTRACNECKNVEDYYGLNCAR
mmetsp:Transcript_144356/g.402198  ORF Transcript_144356/g.402198 Transcript_144356/m.402198 type:complete len:116 (+) Transcript_144356:73-420(+)